MVGAAEDAPVPRVLGVEAGGAPAAGQGARPLVLGVVALPVGAVGADEALDEPLARLLVQVHALAVEPVLARVAADHPPVVVRPPADAVGPVVRLVVRALFRVVRGVGSSLVLLLLGSPLSLGGLRC